MSPGGGRGKAALLPGFIVMQESGGRAVAVSCRSLGGVVERGGYREVWNRTQLGAFVVEEWVEALARQLPAGEVLERIEEE